MNGDDTVGAVVTDSELGMDDDDGEDQDDLSDRSIPDITFFGNLPYDILSPIGVNGRYLYLRSRFIF